MPVFEVIENPRIKRGRKKRSSKRRSVSRRKRRRSPRKNPYMAAYSNPRRSSYKRRGRRRSYSNPRAIAGIDLSAALWVTGGLIAGKLLPAMVRKAWAGMPSTGIGYYAVRIGSVLALGYGVKMITKSTLRSQQVVIGGVAGILYDLYNMYLAPKINGMAFVETAPAGGITSISGFEPTPSGVRLGGFESTPPGVGRYAVTQPYEVMAG